MWVWHIFQELSQGQRQKAHIRLCCVSVSVSGGIMFEKPSDDLDSSSCLSAFLVSVRMFSPTNISKSHLNWLSNRECTNFYITRLEEVRHISRTVDLVLLKVITACFFHLWYPMPSLLASFESTGNCLLFYWVSFLDIQLWRGRRGMTFHVILS